jgi:hypothetical protein
MATLGGREVKGGKGRGGKEREERREEIQWGGGGDRADEVAMGGKKQGGRIIRAMP